MQPLTLTEVWSALCGRWLLVAAGAGTGLVLGLAVHLLVPATYAATTVVQVEDADPAQVDMAVEEAVANSRRVGAEALQSLDPDHPDIDRFEAASTAHAVARSRVLEVTFVDASPTVAARAADAVAQAYLAARAVDASQRAEKEPPAVGSVIDPARVPRETRGPGLRGWAAGGTALGLLLTGSWAAIPRRRIPAALAS